jgi:hypothetical protein
MDVLANEETWKKVLQLIPDDGIGISLNLDVKRELEAEWEEEPSLSSTEKWESLVNKLALKESEKKVFKYF